MATNPTVSELRKAAEISDQEINAAVDAVLADLATEAYPLAKGWILDLVETMRTDERVFEALRFRTLQPLVHHQRCPVIC